jgi:C-5 cytosine-specific DNA methylase
MKPVVIDLCCGLGGWSKAFLAEGWDAIGFDIERHEYGEKKYPADLILKSILEINGYDLRAVNPSVVVASPPCQEYSLWGMRMFHPNPPIPDKRLWEACIRIAREVGVPLVLENVRGAKYFWGGPGWREGPYHLWFYNCPPLPALFPFPYIPLKRKNVVDDIKNGDRRGLKVNARFSSTSVERKRLTAEAAEIPFLLAQHIARAFKP